MRVVFLAALPSILLPAAVSLAAPAAMPVVANSAPSEKRICRSEQMTGTRFPTRVCHTKSEWEAMSESARRGANELIDSPKINNTNEH